MKKILFVMVAMLASMAITGCSSCQSDDEKQDSIISAEQLVNLDREYIFLNYGKDYKWYEVEVTFKNYLDADSVFAPAFIENVFQAGKFAVECKHNLKDSTEYVATCAAWLEDLDMSNDTIKFTLEEAYNLMKKSGYTIPHSRYCTLRRQVGPIPGVNPQYIFGNLHKQLYVDATTGKVSEKNPAFEPTDSVK